MSDRLAAAQSIQEARAIQVSLRMSLTMARSTVNDTASVNINERLAGSLEALVGMPDRVDAALNLLFQGESKKNKKQQIVISIPKFGSEQAPPARASSCSDLPEAQYQQVFHINRVNGSSSRAQSLIYGCSLVVMVNQTCV